MGVPLSQWPQPQQPPIDGVREVLKICLGLGLGLIPAACAILFFAWLCPIGHTACELHPDSSTSTIQLSLFFGTFVAYVAQIVATLVCLIWRATRPISIGLLVMLILGPIVALFGITEVGLHNFHFVTYLSGTLLMLGGVTFRSAYGSEL